LSNKIIHIADFYYPEVLGGGELNNYELTSLIRKSDRIVQEVSSADVTLDFLNANKDCPYIISNFILLDKDCMKYLENNCKYLIYEHDHKYLKSRNPAIYENYLAPKEEIVNFSFYEKAKRVLCQSSFHKNIIYKNLKIENILNLSGNLWDLNSLQIMRVLSKKEKVDCYSILNSNNWHKNSRETVFYCEKKNYDYSLVSSADYVEFLSMLSRNSKFIFLPKTPETLSRVVVEAKMMNIKVITNKNVGATYEHWYKLQGLDLIDYMTQKREEISSLVLRELYE
jgi:hypothetical protein